MVASELVSCLLERTSLESGQDAWAMFEIVAGGELGIVVIILLHCKIGFNSRSIRRLILSEISKINRIKELLYVKYIMLSVSLLDCTDVDFMVEFLCTKYLSGVYLLFLFVFVLCVRFHNNYMIIYYVFCIRGSMTP